MMPAVSGRGHPSKCVVTPRLSVELFARHPTIHPLDQRGAQPSVRRDNPLAGRPGASAERPNRRHDLTTNEPCFLDARELATSIRRKELSAREVMQAHLDQIA